MKSFPLLLLAALAGLLLFPQAAGRSEAPAVEAVSPSPPIFVPSSPGIYWQIERIDTDEMTGLRSSLRLDALDRPHISYFDYSDLALNYAWYDGSNWHIEEVADANNLPTSLVLYIVSGQAYPSISYGYGSPTASLYYARNAGAGWQTYLVDTLSSGGYNALVLDTSGNPHIAYHHSEALWYARWVGFGGNCGPHDSFQCERIDMGTGSLGHYISMVMGSGGHLHISYYDDYNQDLKYAHLVGAGGNCGPGNTWECQTIESADDVGKYNDIILNQYADPVVSYFKTIGTMGLRLATKVGAGLGNCGTGNAWSCIWVDQAAYLSDGTSLARYPGLAATPHISYFYNNGTLKRLEYAHYLGTPGNCGPTNTWYCETVDSDAGMHNSLAIDALNLPHISYYASDQYDLKYARKVRLIFLPIARKP